MKSDVTVILTLYKTPKSKIKNLKNYKRFNTIIFEQNSDGKFKNQLYKKLNYKFEYYHSYKNIGLSKSSNFLLKKVKTKYCLFTQADVNISEKSINLLKNILQKKNDTIFVGPNFKKINSKKKLTKKSYVKDLNLACFLFDVKKLKKINFFDEDFFLYWEDIFLINKINQSKYKMILANNIKAYHEGGKSSKNDLKTQFIRNSNFKYGEFLYDYKIGNFRYLKIIRQFFQNIFYLIFNFFSFNKTNLFQNLAIITGIYKFIKFYLFKKFSSLLNL